MGIDIEADAGHPVLAIDDGVVVDVDASGWDSAADRNLSAVYVEHRTASGQHFVVEYAHVKPASGLKAGDRVLRGDRIATIGAYSYGDHLHLGVTVGQSRPRSPGIGVIGCSASSSSNYTDPTSFLQANQPARARFWDGWLVQYEHDDAPQRTSWFVSEGKRYWVPSAEEWQCHIDHGHRAMALPDDRLRALPDQNGQHTSCLGPRDDEEVLGATVTVPANNTVPTVVLATVPPVPPTTPPTVFSPPPPTPDPGPSVTTPPTAAPAPPVVTSTTQAPTTTTTRPPVTTTTTRPAPRTYPAQQGSHGANTFSNVVNASGAGPRRVNPGEWIQVSCKLRPASTIASAYPDGWWYRIASSPWNNQYYAVANTFWNGDVPGQKPYTHHVDHSIPNC